MLCRCNRGGDNTVAPSSDDSQNFDDKDAAKARKDRINFEADIVGYGLIVLDIMIDWAAMMAFSALIMVIEIHLLDVRADEAFVSAVINYLVQFIPDLVFSVVYVMLMFERCNSLTRSWDITRNNINRHDARTQVLALYTAGLQNPSEPNH